jgi:hypothetical protein
MFRIAVMMLEDPMVLFTLALRFLVAGALVALPASVAAELACGRLLSASAAEIMTVAHPDFIDRPFVDGVSCEELVPGLGCEWEARVVNDQALDRGQSSERRLIGVYDNHVRGTGAWHTLSVFICSAGHVVPVFTDEFLYGVSIEEATAQTLVLKSGHWSDQDPTCCSSQDKRQSYRWDAVNSVYVLTRVVYVPNKKP